MLRSPVLRSSRRTWGGGGVPGRSGLRQAGHL